jgi:hypothetical protein
MRGKALLLLSALFSLSLFAFFLSPKSVSAASGQMEVKVCVINNTGHSISPAVTVTYSDPDNALRKPQTATLDPMGEQEPCPNEFKKTIDVGFVNKLLISARVMDGGQLLYTQSQTITSIPTGFLLFAAPVGAPIHDPTIPGPDVPYAEIHLYWVDEGGTKYAWDPGWWMSSNSFVVKKVDNGQVKTIDTAAFGDVFNKDEAGVYITGKLDPGTYIISINEPTTGQKWGDLFDKIPAYKAIRTIIDFSNNPGQTVMGGTRNLWLASGSFVITGSEAEKTEVWVEVKIQEVSALAEAMGKAVTWLADFITKALKTSVYYINELLQNTKQWVLGGNLEESWTEMRNIGLSLLVLGLIIIAFANVLQIDIQRYGLNRMIPRIILAIIMTYFSWLIVVFFFDFTEAIQRQALALINAHGGGLQMLGNIQIVTMEPSEIVASIGMFLVAIAILVIILISTIVLLFSLLLRVVYLSFLLVIAPLAFIMMIMPFSENLYKKWWQEFWKWMFMGPMAVVIIAIGVSIAGSGATTVIEPNGVMASNNLIKLLILAGAVYFAGTLPKQWGGSIMASWQNAGKKAWGSTGGAAGRWAWDRTGGRAIKRTKMALDVRKTKREDADRLAVRKAMSGITKGNPTGRFRNFLVGNSFNKEIAAAQRQASFQAYQADLVKTYGIDQLDEQEVKNRRKAFLVKKGFLKSEEDVDDLKPEQMEAAAQAIKNDPLQVAYQRYITNQGWTNNGVGTFDQNIFRVLSEIDRHLVEMARQSNRGLLANSGNPGDVRAAIDEAMKSRPSSLGKDEMAAYMKMAQEGAKRGWSPDDAKRRYEALGKKLTSQGLSADEFKEMREAGSYTITQSLSTEAVEEISKRGGNTFGEMRTKAAEIATSGGPSIFSAQVQSHLTSTPAPSGSGGSGGAGGPGGPGGAGGAGGGA